MPASAHAQFTWPDGKSAATVLSQMLVGGVDYTEALRASGLAKYVRTGGGPVDDPDGPHLDTFQNVMDYVVSHSR